DLVRQRLLEHLVAGAIAEQIADHGGDAGHREQRELHVRELHAVQLRARLLRHEPVRRAHEAEQDPDDQEVRVDDLRDVERQDVEQRVGTEILRRRQQAEHDLQAEQHDRDREIPVGDGLRLVAHPYPSRPRQRKLIRYATRLSISSSLSISPYVCGMNDMPAAEYIAPGITWALGSTIDSRI